MVYTDCKTPQAAAKKLKGLNDRETVDAAALAFSSCFMKHFFSTNEEDASRRIFAALSVKGSQAMCETLTGVSMKQLMVEAEIIAE